MQLDLEGVYHSPLGAGEGRPWYGTPGFLEQWVAWVQEDQVGSTSGIEQTAVERASV